MQSPHMSHVRVLNTDLLALINRIRELETERARILPMLSDIHKALDEQRVKLNLLTLTAEPAAPAVGAEENGDA